jgi:hypothetical protein
VRAGLLDRENRNFAPHDRDFDRIVWLTLAEIGRALSDEYGFDAVLHHHERVLPIFDLFNLDGIRAVGHERGIDNGSWCDRWNQRAEDKRGDRD